MKKKSRIIALLLITSASIYSQVTHQWSFNVGGGANEGCISRSSAVDAGGNTYVYGTFKGTLDFDPGVAVNSLTASIGTDLFLAKYNPSGALAWCFNLGNAGLCSAKQIKFDKLNNVVISGTYQNHPTWTPLDLDPGVGINNAFQSTAFATIGNVFVAKYDPAGNYLWSYTPESQTGFPAFPAFAINSSNDVVLAFGIVNVIDLDPTAGTQVYQPTIIGAGAETDIALLKINSTGVPAWVKILDSPTWPQTEIPVDVEIDSQNNIVLTGMFEGQFAFDIDPSPTNFLLTNSDPGSIYDLFLAKYDLNGNFSWGGMIGAAFSWENVRDLEIDNLDNVVIVGDYSSSTDFDITASSQILNSSPTAIIDGDAYIAKYSPVGNIIFAKPIIGSEFETITSLDISTNGIYVTGKIRSTDTDFDPSASTVIKSANSVADQDAFFAKYDNAGNYQWAHVFGGIKSDPAEVDEANSISVVNNNIYISGYFTGASLNNVNLLNTNPLLNPGGWQGGFEYDFFIVKYNESTITGIPSLVKQNVITVYPNPTTGKVIFYNYEVEFSKIEVYTSDGTIVLTAHNTNSISLANLMSGLYNVFLQSKDGSIAWHKVVKI
jgi:hypothetical protein